MFGLVAVIAPIFGYVPRKLANLSPGQVQTMGAVFVVLGGFFLTLGGDPRVRRKVLIGVGAVAGLAVVLLMAGVIHRLFIRQKRFAPGPVSAPPAVHWTPPTAPSGPVAPAPAGPAATPGTTSVAGASGTSPMSALHERRMAMQKEHGRERVWSVTVHLSGAEPPADLEARLGALAGGRGGAVVGRMGGLLQASVAPVEDGERLRAVLTEAFPGARVDLFAAGRQVTVFAVSGTRSTR